MKVGGQAVIDGVLMMGKRVVVAVRKSDGSIDVKELGYPKTNSKWFKIPFVRGFISLFYSLYFGIKALNLSAEMSTGEEMKKGESFFFYPYSFDVGNRFIYSVASLSDKMARI